MLPPHPAAARPTGSRRVGLALLALCVSMGLGARPALARDDVVRSFDGTPLVTHFFAADGLRTGDRAPTVLVAHVWGSHGDRDPGSASENIGTIGLGPLRRAGFNVLTWDARGFAGSGGTVELDAPAFEGRDVSELLDYVARQPESLDDAPGDPRAGMAGASYGGGIQLVAAGLDQRIDAIVPDLSWHSWIPSLFRDGSPKLSWGPVLAVEGLAAVNSSLFRSGGLERAAIDPQIEDAFLAPPFSGSLAPRQRAFLESRGPGDLVGRIRAPTLFTQGTIDTVFPLREAIENYATLRRNGVPVKMLWFCGGHGICRTRSGPPGLIENAGLAWFRRYLLRDASVDTGPRFEWIADDGARRSAADYPLTPRPELKARGSGAVAVSPAAGATDGNTIAAYPASSAYDLAFAPPSTPSEIVGEPTVTIAYSGSSAKTQTFLYAQIVDLANSTVLGNQVTPIPVTLDGRPHTVTRSLEAVAAHGTPSSRYELQIAAGTSVYAPQRSWGNVSLRSVEATLPVGDPAATPLDPPVSPQPARSRTRVTIAKLAPSRCSTLRRTHRVLLLLRASRRVAGATLTLSAANGTKLARRSRLSIGATRRVSLTLRRPPPTCTIVARVSGRSGGVAVRASHRWNLP